MRKSDLIKILESIEGDPVVGLDVLTNKGSEFWAMSPHHIHTNDRGATLALTTCRLRAAIPASKQVRVKIAGVDSVACDVESVLQKFTEKYDISQMDQDFDYGEFSLQECLLSQVYEDLSQLVRLLEDMLRIFDRKEFYQKYGVIVK